MSVRREAQCEMCNARIVIGPMEVGLCAACVTKNATAPAKKPVSSYCPPFNLIPLSALVCLAKRYELGAKKYGPHSWIDNMDRIGVEYVIERLNHTVYHCLKLISKLENRIPWDGDDDASAILWGGACAAEALTRIPELANVNVDPESDV